MKYEKWVFHTDIVTFLNFSSFLNFSNIMMLKTIQIIMNEKKIANIKSVISNNYELGKHSVEMKECKYAILLEDEGKPEILYLFRLRNIQAIYVLSKIVLYITNEKNQNQNYL